MTCSQAVEVDSGPAREPSGALQRRWQQDYTPSGHP